jgi:hypothetical protein
MGYHVDAARTLTVRLRDAKTRARVSTEAYLRMGVRRRQLIDGCKAIIATKTARGKPVPAKELRAIKQRLRILKHL